MASSGLLRRFRFEKKTLLKIISFFLQCLNGKRWNLSKNNQENKRILEPVNDFAKVTVQG